MWWAWLSLGFIVGVNFGLFLGALCVAASDKADASPRSNIVSFRLEQLRRAKKGKKKWQA